MIHIIFYVPFDVVDIVVMLCGNWGMDGQKGVWCPMR